MPLVLAITRPLVAMLVESKQGLEHVTNHSTAMSTSKPTCRKTSGPIPQRWAPNLRVPDDAGLRSKRREHARAHLSLFAVGLAEIRARGSSPLGIPLYEQATATYAPTTPRSKQTLAPPNRQWSLLAASSFSRRQDSKEDWAYSLSRRQKSHGHCATVPRALPLWIQRATDHRKRVQRGREDAAAAAAALTGASTGTSAAVAAMGGEADWMDGRWLGRGLAALTGVDWNWNGRRLVVLVGDDYLGVKAAETAKQPTSQAETKPRTSIFLSSFPWEK
jgi:hypothetical protein